MNRPPERAEAVVVGAGVVGLAVALELAATGRRVCVLERGRIGRGASWAAGGMLAPVSEAEFETEPLMDLACDSLRRYPEFVERVERLGRTPCGYRRDGTLWVAVDHDGAEELRHLAELLVERKLEVQPLSADEARSTEPHLGGRVLECMRVAGDHQVDPRALCLGMARALSGLGSQVREGLQVEGVQAAAGGGLAVWGRAADGAVWQLESSTVVVAGGAWSEHELELPLPASGLRPVKGQLVRLRGPQLIRHVLRAPDVYLVPRADGELLLGATMEEMGFDGSATAGAAMDLLRHAWEVLPGIYDLELVEVSVGLRSAVDDHLPVIGGTEVPGLFLAFGHFRNGVLLAPATARYLSQWIDRGQQPPELAAFSPRRLATEAAT